MSKKKNNIKKLIKEYYEIQNILENYNKKSFIFLLDDKLMNKIEKLVWKWASIWIILFYLVTSFKLPLFAFDPYAVPKEEEAELFWEVNWENQSNKNI